MNLMTIKQASAHLRVKPSWLRHKIFKKEIPFLKMGKFIRFDLDELERWVKSGISNSGGSHV